jgi:hypothetical protein
VSGKQWVKDKRRNPYYSAIHEAGHAVYAIHNDWIVSKVSIDPAEIEKASKSDRQTLTGQPISEHAGFCRIEASKRKDGHLKRRGTFYSYLTLICIGGAGPLAERKARKRNRGMSAIPEESLSRHNPLIQELCIPEGRERDVFDSRMALSIWLRRAVDHSLRTHWREIEAVAAALMERGTLTGREVREVMKAAQDAA